MPLVSEQTSRIKSGDDLLLKQFFFVVMLAGDTRLRGCDRSVAIIICKHVNRETRDAFPSYIRIATATGYSQRAVAKSIKKLVELGLVIRVSGAASRDVNHYTPVFPQVRDTSILTGPVHAEARTTELECSSLLNQSAVVIGTGVHTNLLTELADRREASEGKYSYPSGSAQPVGAPPAGNGEAGESGATPGFDAWYAASPKKVKPDLAREEYAIALRVDGVTPELLLAKMVEYSVVADRKEGGKYIKQPHNWLKHKWWNPDLWPRPNKQRVTPDWDKGSMVLGLELRTTEQDEDGPGGVLIDGIHENCPLPTDILQDYDVIVQVNGRTVKTPGQVRKYVASARGEGCSDFDVMLKRHNSETDEWDVEHVTVPLPTEAPVAEQSARLAAA